MLSTENPLPDLGPNPWELMLGGEDVVLGREIVEYLRAEGVGVAVLRKGQNNKQRIVIDKTPEKEEYLQEIKDETESTLLGLVVPTGNPNQFAYLGLNEPGLVVTIKNGKEHYVNKFSGSHGPNYLISLYWLNLSHLASDVCSIDLSERDNPDEFQQIFTASVQKERQKLLEQKKRRAESRRKIKNDLLPQEPQEPDQGNT